MNMLRKRVEALESGGAGGLVLLLVTALPGEDRETAVYDGVTYRQSHDETAEQFRERLAECLKHEKKCFIWVSELDATL